MKDEAYMERAIVLARAARAVGEPPFGAVVVDPDGDIASEAHDEVRALEDFTRHAEVEAVRRACAARGADLSGFTLYTTVEPCPMCFTAAWLSRVQRVVFGCTMSAVARATRGAQRELLVPAELMNARAGAGLSLAGGVLERHCLALFLGD